MKHSKLKAKTVAEDLPNKKGTKLKWFSRLCIGFNIWFFNLKTLLSWKKSNESIKSLTSDEKTKQFRRKPEANKPKINWNLITKPLRKKNSLKLESKTLNLAPTTTRSCCSKLDTRFWKSSKKPTLKKLYAKKIKAIKHNISKDSSLWTKNSKLSLKLLKRIKNDISKRMEVFT